MVQYFVPDPLSDPNLLQAVLGDMPMTPEPAEFADHVLVEATPKGLCALRPAARAVAWGVLLDLNEAQAARFDFWGAAHGWSKAEVSPRTRSSDGQAALAFVDAGASGEEGNKVSPACAQRWVPIWCEAAGEILSYDGVIPAAEVASRLPVIWSRAHARLSARAETRESESGLSRRDVELRHHARPYSNFFEVDEFSLTHEKFDGGRTPEILRAVFMASDAVTVLPYDPKRDRVLLVEQFRAGPYARGDASPWILEPVAGRIDPSDTPEETARREAKEEAGLTLGDLHLVGRYYPSTGCMSEFIHSFVGEADLPDDAAGLAGLASENEDIKGHVLSRADLMDRVRAGAIPDAPLILTAYWLQANLHLFGRGH